MRTQRRITDVPYVLRKNGYFYGHDSKGYVARFELAELYSKARAESEAQQVEGVTAHPITEFARDSDALDPHDPSDLNRCLLLLDEIPALRPLMPKMAVVSEQWSKLVGQVRYNNCNKGALEQTGESSR